MTHKFNGHAIQLMVMLLSLVVMARLGLGRQNGSEVNPGFQHPQGEGVHLAKALNGVSVGAYSYTLSLFENQRKQLVHT